MLSINDEKRIRNMVDLDPDASSKSISNRVDVSRAAVQRVKGTMDAIRKLGAAKSAEVKNLILMGLPEEAIALEAIVSREDVREVGWYYFLQRRDPGRDTLRCPTCDSMMFSRKLKEKKIATKRLGMLQAPAISKAQAKELYRAVVDLCELDKLCVVSNPLFHFLARRSETILGAIRGNKK